MHPFRKLYKLAPSSETEDIVDLVNRIIDHIDENTIVEGDNIILERTPIGVTISAEVQQVSNQIERESELRFS